MITTMSFVLDGFPRTGSTTLTRILNLHSGISCAMEPFHPKRFDGLYHRVALTDGMTEALRQIAKDKYNGLKHIWEPELGWPFAGHEELNEQVVEHAAVVVTMRRRNLLKQYVSGYISRHLHFWVGTRADFYERLNSINLPPLRIAQAAASIEATQRATHQREAFLSTLPARRRTLYYEDIFVSLTSLEQQVTFCNELFEFLGFPAMDTEIFRRKCKTQFNPEIYKWSSEEIYSRIPGAAALEQSLGNDETGRLFT